MSRTVDLKAVDTASTQLARATRLAQHTLGQVCDGDLPMHVREFAERNHALAITAVHDLQGLYAKAQAGDT